jgi:16S rRNA (cytidine1402-2'-O)-methyltransferase
MPGTLYIVSMPIGHPDDLTHRAVEVLKNVSLVVAEEPSTTKTLLDRYDIATPITSYHGPGQEKVAVLVKRLRLVQRAVRAGIGTVPVPGPSAAIAALPVAALPGESFYFHGSLPDRPSARASLLHRLQHLTGILVFFERDDRLQDSLKSMRTILGNRRMVVAWDMTKPHEGFRRGRVDQLIGWLARRRMAGEVTLLIEGHRPKRRKLPKN